MQYKLAFALTFRSAYYNALGLSKHTAALGIAVVNDFDIFSCLTIAPLFLLFVTARYVTDPGREMRSVREVYWSKITRGGGGGTGVLKRETT